MEENQVGPWAKYGAGESGPWSKYASGSVSFSDTDKPSIDYGALEKEFAWQSQLKPGALNDPGDPREGAFTKALFLQAPGDLMHQVGRAAAGVGNELFDPVHGWPNQLLQAMGREGWDKDAVEHQFGGPDIPKYPKLFTAGKPLLNEDKFQFANEDIDPVNKVLGDLIRGSTTPEMLATLPLAGTRPVQALLASQTIPGTVQGMHDYGEAQTDYEKQKAMLNVGANLAFAAGLGHQLLKGETVPQAGVKINPDGSIDVDSTAMSDPRLLSDRQSQFMVPGPIELQPPPSPRGLLSEGNPSGMRLAEPRPGVASDLIQPEGESGGEKSRGPISEGKVDKAQRMQDLQNRSNLSMFEMAELKALQDESKAANSPDAWAEFRRQMQEQQAKSQKITPTETAEDLSKQLEEEQAHQKLYGGLPFLDPDFLSSQLGIAKQAKVDAIQLYNRIRNKLGEKSLTWEMLEPLLPKSGKVTPEEIGKLVEEQGPRVEVKKFGEGASTPDQKELNNLIHEIETEHQTVNNVIGLNRSPEKMQDLVDRRLQPKEDDGSYKFYPELDEEGRKLIVKYHELEKKVAADPNRPMQGANWQSVSPKPESSMPGYTEIAVVKPLKGESTVIDKDTGVGRFASNAEQGIQFPSSHHFPPNTLAFTRGYMETLSHDIPSQGLKKGDKVWHVVEVQSDWAQQIREETESAKAARQGYNETHTWPDRKLKEIEQRSDPLLREYNRLALKAAIEHARENGAKAVAVQDAESAMMMEGHDLAARPHFAPDRPQVHLAEEQLKEQFRNKGWTVRPNDEQGHFSVSEPGLQSGYLVLKEGPGQYSFPRSIINKIKLESVRFQSPQEPGMRLNYDRILPSIAEEITGSKGEKVSFGEHKMAFGNEEPKIKTGEAYFDELEHKVRVDQEGNIDFQDKSGKWKRQPQSELPPPVVRLIAKRFGREKSPRKDLIFRNESGAPKTDVSARLYPLEGVRKQLTLTGRDKGAIKPKEVAQRPSELFALQDAGPERIVHARGWQMAYPRLVLEGTGDIYRELTKYDSGWYAKDYVNEKMTRVEKWLSNERTGHGHHLQDVHDSMQANPELHKQLAQAYKDLPYQNQGQYWAKTLTKDIAEGKINEARLSLEQLKKWLKDNPPEKTEKPSGKLYGGIPFLDPDFWRNEYKKWESLFKSSPTKERASQLLDAADNKAKIMARQYGNRIRTALPNELDRQALTFVIEAGDDRSILRAMKVQVAGNRRAEAAIDRAYSDWTRLKPHADEASRVMEGQRTREQSAGIDTDQVENYIKHAYDFSRGILFDGGKGGGGVSSSFKKQRTYANYATAIEAGLKPTTLDAANLIESRISAGSKMVNRVEWGNMLKRMVDPISGEPVGTALIRQPKGTMVAPKGYTPREVLPGIRIAIKDEYAGLFDALLGSSAVTNSWAGRGALRAEGFIKHGLLMFDSFHASRMLQKSAFIKGLPSYRKGYSLLEYDDPTLNRMVARGDIPASVRDWVRTNRGPAKLLLDNGLNVGRINDALYSDVVRKQLKVAGVDINVPGRFNRWVFEKVTRGAMLEAGLTEFQRIQKANPTWTDRKVAAYVAKQINVFFGNVGRQGIFKSNTFRDILQIVMLAPQWVEGLVQTEARAYAQALKMPFGTETTTTTSGGTTISRTKWSPKVGTALKGTAVGLAAYFVGVQLLNMYFRHQPTWENKEKDHKLDAWIPDPTGKTPGFFLSPLSVAAEVTHDAMRYSHGKDFLETSAQIAANKASPLSRSVITGVTGRDYRGQKILDTGFPENRLKQAGKALLPLPLPVAGLTSDTPGANIRQAVGSLGLKIEPANKREEETENLGRLSLSDRARAEKAQAKGKEVLPLQSRYAIAQSATDLTFKRDLELQKRLDPKINEFLQANNLQLRGYKPEITQLKTSLRLSEDEAKRFEDLVVQHYNEKLQMLMQRDNITQKRLDNNLEQARAKAVRDFKKEYRSSH